MAVLACRCPSPLFPSSLPISSYTRLLIRRLTFHLTPLYSCSRLQRRQRAVCGAVRLSPSQHRRAGLQSWGCGRCDQAGGGRLVGGLSRHRRQQRQRLVSQQPCQPLHRYAEPEPNNNNNINSNSASKLSSTPTPPPLPPPSVDPPQTATAKRRLQRSSRPGSTRPQASSPSATLWSRCELLLNCYCSFLRFPHSSHNHAYSPPANRGG